MYTLLISLAAFYGASVDATSLPPRQHGYNAVRMPLGLPTRPQGRPLTLRKRDEEPCEDGCAAQSYSTDLIWMANGRVPGINIQFGNDDPLTVFFDTGSTPFWVPGANWECVDDISGNINNITHRDRKACGETKTLPADFSFSGGAIPDQGFHASYVNGELGALGVVGYQDVAFVGSGLTIPKVVTGVASEIDNEEDNNYGLFGAGLAYSYPAYYSLSELKETGGDIDEVADITWYPSVIQKAVADGVFAPKFSYYLSGIGGADGSPCGKLIFGGEPDDVAIGPYTASIPVLRVGDYWESKPDKLVYELWFIHADGFKIVPVSGNAEPTVFSFLDDENPDPINAPSKAFNHTLVIDTGTTLTNIPDEVFYPWAKLIDPAPILEEDSGLYTVPCDQTLPGLVLTVGGADLSFKESMILPRNEKSCHLGVQPAGAGPSILGVTFLVNVVTVHELGDAPAVKFAQRM
ncbi:unnamed protein product [Zymoseptoria tritici ST99CH_3D7]|uniref:Peptidase A1 domain-containing protein n=1 Tax=Zymoseptoria tritici (strain ST99CH_3D7) TaxID=1276538 RepID=A0A1X7RXR8_ZYMT9|nr:unnamed protein product [Zymoseptoria tritici ST99CH_3D7]